MHMCMSRLGLPVTWGLRWREGTGVVDVKVKSERSGYGLGLGRGRGRTRDDVYEDSLNAIRYHRYVSGKFVFELF